MTLLPVATYRKDSSFLFLGPDSFDSGDVNKQNKRTRRKRLNGLKQRQQVTAARAKGNIELLQLTEWFFKYERDKEEVKIDTIVSNLVKLIEVDPIYAVTDEANHRSITLSTFDNRHRDRPTLSTLCCYLNDHPNLDKRHFLRLTLEQFLLKPKEHPDFQTFMGNERQNFSRYCVKYRSSSDSARSIGGKRGAEAAADVDSKKPKSVAASCSPPPPPLPPGPGEVSASGLASSGSASGGSASNGSASGSHSTSSAAAGDTRELGSYLCRRSWRLQDK